MRGHFAVPTPRFLPWARSRVLAIGVVFATQIHIQLRMRSILVPLLMVLVSPAAYAQPALDGTFAEFATHCRTNVGIHTECEKSVLEAAHVAFGPEAVVCIYPAIWPVAEQLANPPAAERPWKDVVKVLVEDKGICTPDRPRKKQ